MLGRYSVTSRLGSKNDSGKLLESLGRGDGDREAVSAVFRTRPLGVSLLDLNPSTGTSELCNLTMAQELPGSLSPLDNHSVFPMGLSCGFTSLLDVNPQNSIWLTSMQ